MAEGLGVGDRLQVGRDRATVRYIGFVDGQQGTWAGLEWDNPARGKHDGRVAGQKYFECLYNGMSYRLCLCPLPLFCHGHAPPTRHLAMNT